MLEHQPLSFKKAIGLSIIPIVWGVLSSTQMNVSADNFSTTTELSNQNTANTQKTNDQSASGDSLTTQSTDAPIASTENTTIQASSSEPQQNLQTEPAPTSTHNDQSEQPTDTSTTSFDESGKLSDTTGKASSSLATQGSTSAPVASQSNSTNPPTSKPNGESEHMTIQADTPPQSSTATESEISARIKQYLKNFNTANQTNYEFVKTTMIGKTIESDLVDTPGQTLSTQILYTKLTDLLNNFISENRVYLLRNFHGNDLAFDLQTSNNEHVSVGKTLVIPIYVKAVDENGRQIGNLIPVTNSKGGAVEYGDSWTVSPSRIDDYQLTAGQNTVTGSWNDSFDYNQLNDQGQLIIQYTYLKIPPTPVTPPVVVTPTIPTTPPSEPILTQPTQAPQATTIAGNSIKPTPSAPTPLTQQTVKATVPRQLTSNSSVPRATLIKTSRKSTSKLTYALPAASKTSSNPFVTETSAPVNTKKRLPTVHVRLIIPTTVIQHTQFQQYQLKLKSLAEPVQLSTLLTNPVIEPNHQINQLPGGKPVHTQLGEYFAMLSGTINFGTTPGEENHLKTNFYDDK